MARHRKDYRNGRMLQLRGVCAKTDGALSGSAPCLVLPSPRFGRPAERSTWMLHKPTKLIREGRGQLARATRQAKSGTAASRESTVWKRENLYELQPACSAPSTLRTYADSAFEIETSSAQLTSRVLTRRVDP